MTDKPSEHGAKQDQEDAARHASLRSTVIYETVRQEGEEELNRPVASLWWSGIAGGLALSASTYGEAFLGRHLPDTEWSPLIENFGYCLGFLVVILSRFQLFTENTITVILPLLATPGRRILLSVAKLWSVVLAANLAGTVASAFFVTYLDMIEPDGMREVLEISREAAAVPFLKVFAHAVPAGFLIAALVWILPSAEGGTRFWAIVAVTYLIAIGGGTHIVVGSTEVFLLVFAGELDLGRGLYNTMLPALIGNVVGGTGLFALIAYGQVRKEL